MTGAQDTIDHEAFEAQCRAGIEAWVAEHLGGEVVAMERLERWRPQWKVSYTSGGDANTRTTCTACEVGFEEVSLL